METRYTCPLCGHRFRPESNRACANCVLHRDCGLLCCPACGYTSTDPRASKFGRWLQSGLNRSGKG